MTNVLITPVREGRHAGDRVARVGLPTLVQLELRKLLDTRAGAWLHAAVAVLTVGVMAVAATADASLATGSRLVSFGAVAVSLILPVTGILALTSEWAQGSVVTTFVFVPRRSRVVLAKLLALAISATVASALVLVAGAAVAAITRLFRDDPAGAWDVTATHALTLWLGILLSMAMGASVGSLVMIPPTAIVVYMGVPLAWSVGGQLVDSAQDLAPWLDTSVTFSRLLDASVSGTEQWQQVAVSTLVWVVVPLILGLVRLSRREIR